MLTKLEFSKKNFLAPNLKSLKNYDWYQDLIFFNKIELFRKIYPELSFSDQFWLNSTFSSILIKIEVKIEII